MTYVAQRLAQIAIDSPGKQRFPHITRHIRDLIRREYFAKCPCCGERPSMAALARKHGVAHTTVWRIVNKETHRIGRKVGKALRTAIDEARHAP